MKNVLNKFPPDSISVDILYSDQQRIVEKFWAQKQKCNATLTWYLRHKVQAHLKLININQVRLGFKIIQIEPICLGPSNTVTGTNTPE